MKTRMLLVLLLVSGPKVQAQQAEMNGMTVAIEEISQAAIRAGALITTGRQEKVLVDRQNTRITMGPQSVAEFSGQGAFRLLRGSCYLEAKVQRNFQTINASVDFVGRVLVSYDHKEHSTSTFVLAGEARMKNPYEQDRTVQVSKLQGASLVTGDVYPNLVRGLDFAQADEWLKGYHWPTQARKELLEQVPTADAMQAKLAEAEKSLQEQSTPEGRVGLKKEALADYFSTIYEGDDTPKKYEEYNAVDDGKSPETLAKTEKEDILSPEHAALIPLPDTQIDLGFETLSAQQAVEEVKAPVREPKATRKIASVAKPRIADAAPRSAEDLVLERLRHLSESRGQSVARAPRENGRGPASISAEQVPAARPVAVQPKARLVPDPVYDLSENF